MARKYVIGGNWKSNGTQSQVASLIEMLNGVTVDTESVEVIVAPTSLFLATAQAQLKPEIKVSSQNVSLTGPGAFTGEIAAEHLKDLGLQWTLTGHSERRSLYGETDLIVAQKTKRALEQGLDVIVCVGETLEERKNDQTVNVITRQLKAVADLISEDLWSRIVVAYEPVWAIGTGVVATPEQAQDAHKNLRAWVAASISPEVAQNLRIIYGGSVNAKNCNELIALHDVDGFLVGGASLKPEFVDIIQSAQ
ncbi:triosephosphate isomerase [Thraustotheca clavata]|uniref:Triosephosphate isomerase n=1 Tax=Thraustotheca clavata TaxID=74557 RepID=A0A1V9Z9F9_9STRA|nr:triosephosphate isomerase [Thraustotheca clavata]